MCRVRIEKGTTNPPTDAEKVTLTESMLATGIRLACQTQLLDDAGIEVLNPHPNTEWRALERKAIFAKKRRFASADFSGWGLAIDFGTTHVSISLIERRSGCRKATRTGLNRQNLLGADIMTRLQRAAEDDETHQLAVQLARETVGCALADLCLGEGFNPHKIDGVCIVGNSAMVLLLLGGSPPALLTPAGWGSRPRFPEPKVQELIAAWNLHPETQFLFPPPLYGFVGSDLLVGIAATELSVERETAVFVDFGTNSEIALWHGGRLFVTSAAGGPAFEGSGLSCGASARSGAIHRVAARADGGLTREVLGNTSPTGLCGSGLVDLLAVWRQRNFIDEVGRFAEETRAAALPIFPDLPDLQLSRRDVDLLQRAKAAVAAGLKRLLDLAGVSAASIGKFYIGGAFGRFLQVESAIQIGLVPSLPEERFTICGNTALAGAELQLCDQSAIEECDKLQSVTTGVNLADDEQFEQLYLESLFLNPWPAIEMTTRAQRL